MSRKYKPFRQKELDGGINLYSSPNEIDNKQAVLATNFNASGNKLTNAKDKELELTTGDGLIQSITIDNNNLWYIKNDTLYKDGVEIISKSGARLGIKGLTYNYISNITNPNGDTISQINAEDIYFPEGIDYAITVNGVDYIVNGTSKDDLYQKLKTQLEIAGFTCIISGGYIYITSDSAITVIVPNYTQKVIFLQNTISNSGVWTDANNSKGFIYTVGGKRGLYFTSAIYSQFGSAVAFDKYIRDEVIDELLIHHPTSTFKKTTLNKDINGNLIIAGDIAGDYAGIILPIDMSATFATSATSQILAINSTGNWTSAYTGLHTVTLTKGGIPTVIDINALGLSTMELFMDYIKANGFSKSYFVNNEVFKVAGYSYYYILFIQGDNYEIVTSSSTYGGLGTLSTTGLPVGLTFQAFVISDNSFDYLVLGDSLTIGKASTTVGNLGTLVVDEDNGGAYYYGEDLLIKLNSDAVGEPKVGTLYQGKIILGGYANNDNIVYSITSSITDPLDLLIFDKYNAGGQSISGGNKSKITGMKTGENGLYVFKEDEIWYTNTEYDNPASNSFNFIFRKLTGSGALSQSVITEIGQEILYLDWKNRAVRRLSYEQNLTTLRDNAISENIYSLLSNLPEDQGLATATYSYPNYRLYLSDHTGGTITYANGKTYFRNNKCFVYNVERKSWFTETVLNIILSNSNFVVKSNGDILKEEINNLSSGNFLSKQYDMGDAVGYKRYTEFEIYGKKDEEVTLYVDIYEDGALYDTFIVDSNYGEEFRNRFDFFTEGRYFQFGLRYEGAGYLEINEFAVSFKPIEAFDSFQG